MPKRSSKRSRKPTWPKGPQRRCAPATSSPSGPPVMTHDNTSAVMKKFKAIGAKRVFNDPSSRSSPSITTSRTRRVEPGEIRCMEAFAREHGIDFYPAGTGIGHQIMVEQGYVVPGTFVVASDSHSNMYGALGAIGTPVVRTDAAAVWATGEFWWQVPRTIQVVLEGQASQGVTGKDVIITLCGLYNHEEVLNAAVEFTGPGVASLSMDARFTIANMTTEWGALVGWFPVDEVTMRVPARRADGDCWSKEHQRFTEDDIERWATMLRRCPIRMRSTQRVSFSISIRSHRTSPVPTQCKRCSPWPRLRRRESRYRRRIWSRA